MQLGLRILLIVGAIAMLAFVLGKIRNSQLKTSDAVFWFLFAGCLVVISIFPQIVYWAAALVGIQSPANLVFLLVFIILIVKLLLSSVETAQLKSKLNILVEYEALRDTANERRANEPESEKQDA